MLLFHKYRAEQWYILFVNIKNRLSSAYAGGESEVNRVRENERGWDALNENHYSPVHETVVRAGLYAFLSRKREFTRPSKSLDRLM